jgi:plastocyanin
MRSMRVTVVLFLGLWAVVAAASTTTAVADKGERSRKIALLDDCDPTDPAWGVNGCIREEGSVSRAEFDAFVLSPLSTAVVGHPSWTISPALLQTEKGRIRVTNEGGRGHTFTEVADFGGGAIPPLRVGLITAPECPANPAALNASGTVIPPGGRVEITGLAAGTHKFMCCIHSWMRAVVKVEPEDDDK